MIFMLGRSSLCTVQERVHRPGFASPALSVLPTTAQAGRGDLMRPAGGTRCTAPRVRPA